MASENKPGLMAQNTLVSGVKIELMARVSLFMLTETSMMVFGRMIKLMVLVYTSM